MSFLLLINVFMSKSDSVTWPAGRASQVGIRALGLRDLGTQAVTKLKLGLWECRKASQRSQVPATERALNI
jgi:hypothetical protein